MKTAYKSDQVQPGKNQESIVSEKSLKGTKLEPQNSLTTTLKSKRMKKHQDWKRRSQNLDHMKLLYNAKNIKLPTETKGMNGDQRTVRNNAFPNVPKKNHLSQGIIISSHSLSFSFL